MLDLLAKSTLMPSCYVLILHENCLISFKLVDYFVGYVLLLVCQLLVSFFSFLDRFLPVLRPLHSTAQLPLSLLELATFSN